MDSLIGRIINLTDWLTDPLIDWLMIYWLTDWLIGWLIYKSIDQLMIFTFGLINQKGHIDGSMQACSSSSTKAMEITVFHQAIDIHIQK